MLAACAAVSAAQLAIQSHSRDVCCVRRPWHSWARSTVACLPQRMRHAPASDASQLACTGRVPLLAASGPQCISPTGAHADRTLTQLARQVLAGRLTLWAKPEAGCPPHHLSSYYYMSSSSSSPHSYRRTAARPFWPPLASSSFLVCGLKSRPLPSSATPWQTCNALGSECCPL